jgi:hypothetical protein
MVVTLDPEIERGIAARAASRGLSLREHVQEVLAKDLASSAGESLVVEGQFRNLSELLLNSPFAGSELDLERSQELPRSIRLG